MGNELWVSQWYEAEAWPFNAEGDVNQLRSEIERDLESLLSEAEKEGLSEFTDDWRQVTEAASAVKVALTAELPFRAMLQIAKFEAVHNAIGAARKHAEEEQERLRVEAERIKGELDKLGAPEDAEEGEWTEVKNAVGVIGDLIKGPKFKKVDVESAASKLLNEIPGKVEAAKLVIKARLERWQKEAENLEESLKGFEKLDPNAEEKEWEGIKTACEQVRTKLGEGKLSAKILQEATEKRDLIPALVEEAKKAIKVRVDKGAVLLAEVTPAEGVLSVDPEGALPGQKAKLEKARKAVRDEVAKTPFTADALAAAEKARETLELLNKAVAKEIEDLGGKEEIEALTNTLGSADAIEKVQEAFGLKAIGEVKTLITDLGGKENAKKLLDTFKPETRLASTAKNLGGAKCMGALLEDGFGGDAKKLDGLVKAFGGNFSKLQGVLETGGLKNQPKALAALVKTGAGGNAKDFKIFCEAYTNETDLNKLQKLLTDGGLGAKPECLAQMLSGGMNGKDMRAKTQGLQSWTRTIEPSMGKLGTMLSGKDGVGDNPDVFVSLVKDGCGGAPGKFKTLLDSFDESGMGKLNDLVSSGGFGIKGSPEVKPDCLSKLLTIGCDGKPADLAKLCNKLTTTDHGNLKALMTTGGLGDQPEVLGHLIKTGCPGKPEGGEWDVQKFGTEMAKNPGDLKALLTTGGFAQKGTKPVVKPECLAELLGTGCGGDPVKLKALGIPTNLPKLKGLLETGGLGAQPLSLGHAYKLGCDQDPAKLATLHDQFNGSGGTKLGRLADLLENGNLKQRPEMLGEILGTGCDKNPENLKNLAIGFHGNMGQLKEMVGEWGEDSGEAIKTLEDSRHLNGNFQDLQKRFGEQLNNRYPRRQDAKRRKELIKAAPNFKRKVVDQNTLNSGLVPPLSFTQGELGLFSGTDCDYLLAHVCERHLPSHFAFKNSTACLDPINHSQTQFPKEHTPQDVANTVKSALMSDKGIAALVRLYNIAQAWTNNLNLRNDYLNYGDWLRHYNLYQDKLVHDQWVADNGPRWERYWQNGGNQPWGEDPGPRPNFPYPPRWARVDPGPEPYPDPGFQPDPGPPPKPTDTFKFGSTTFQVGVSYGGGQWKIGQFFPISGGAGVEEYDGYEMTTLCNGMVP